MRQMKKCYKKILSCMLAAALTVTSVAFQGADVAYAVSASEVFYEWTDADGATWRLYKDGIVVDSQGANYELNTDNQTALVKGFEGSGHSYVLAASIPMSYAECVTAWNDADSAGKASGEELTSLSNTGVSRVTGIVSRAFAGNGMLESVTLQEGFEDIASQAFWRCTALKTVVLPESLTTIGQNAFAECTSLQSIKIPSGVTSMGSNAFLSCTGLQDVEISSSALGKIPEAAFKDCSSLKEIELKAGITEIGVSAFANSVNLLKLVIPDSVTAISPDALDGVPTDRGFVIYCSSGSAAEQFAAEKGYTTSITGQTENPGNTEEPVPSQAPANTPEVPTASPSPAASQEPTATGSPAATPVPEESSSPTAVPAQTPEGTPQATAAPIQTPEGTPQATAAPVQTPEGTPQASAAPAQTPGSTPQGTVKPVQTPGGTPQGTVKPAETDVPPSPVESPSVTESPDVNDTVVKKNISYQLDSDQESVTVNGTDGKGKSSVVIPAAVMVNGKSYPVTKVAKNAFRGNTSVKKVTLGKNIKTIEASAFRGCTKLTEVNFPSNIKTIGKNSFYNCKKLKKVVLPDSVKSIKKAAFKNCTSLKNFTIGTNPKTKKGSLLIGGRRVRFGAGTIKIDIGAQALANCKSLTSLVINRMVTRIGNSAFKGCTSLSDIIVRSLQLQRVDKGALTGVSNCKISVPTKKVKPYTVLFKNKGQGKKVVVAKI